MTWPEWLRRIGVPRPSPGVAPRASAGVGDIEKRVADLEIRARVLVDSFHPGGASSVFRGRGIELDSVREYRAGDSVRTVDWRVTARRGRLHVREFVEERELEVLVVLDRSASLHGGENPTVGAMALDVSAALTLASADEGHRVALLQMTDDVEAYVPPGTGRRHARRLLRSLLAVRPARTRTDLTWGLELAGRTLGSRSLVAVVSDFSPPPDVGLTAVVARLARRHEVVPVRMRVPGVEVMPDVGLVDVVEPETGRATRVDTSDPRVREESAAAAVRAEQAFRDLCGTLNLDPVTLGPGSAVALELRRRFGRRRERAA